MLTKSELRDALTTALEDVGIEDADEVAYSVVEVLDERGAFEDPDDLEDED